MHEVKEMLIFPERLEQAEIPYMATGSVASVVYGEPRMTYDIDLVVRLHEKSTAQLSGVFGTDEFYLPPIEVIRQEANRETRGHFNIINFKTGAKADIYLIGNDPLHLWAFKYRRQYELSGIKLWVAPLVYVIIRKLQFYEEGGSEKHIRDIKSMLRILGEEIDGETLKDKLEEHRLTEVWRELF